MNHDEWVVYDRNHQRLMRRRGPAKDQVCIDCGQPAAEWSHRHDTDPEDTANYDPRCRPCHRVYDGRDKLTAEQRAKISEGVRRSYARRRANPD